jgi:outer membrane biosynthesis protein TonB
MLLLAGCAHGPLSPAEEDQRAIHPLKPALMACNSEPHSGDGRIVVRFTVAPAGTVSNVHAEFSEGLKNVAACVERVIASATYDPRPAGEDRVMPFRF